MERHLSGTTFFTCKLYICVYVYTKVNKQNMIKCISFHLNNKESLRNGTKTTSHKKRSTKWGGGGLKVCKEYIFQR